MGYIEKLREKIGHDPLLLPRTSVIVLDRKIGVLLQKRRDGIWNLPGGFLELEETVEQAARREVKEETGVEIGEVSLLGIFSGKEYFKEMENGDQVYPLSIHFLSTDILAGGPSENSDEAIGAKYFPIDQLPEHLSPFARRVIDHYGASFF